MTVGLARVALAYGLGCGDAAVVAAMVRQQRSG